jgi:uncharacterized membrane protein YtjA (UPF0391 family)
MRKTIPLLCILVLAFAGVASADSLNYQVIGYGGLSPAVSQVSQILFGGRHQTRLTQPFPARY